MRRQMRVGESGFSLLELVVAVAVMGLAITMLYRLDAGAVRGVGDYAQHQQAGVLARSILESRDAVPPEGWAEAGQDGAFDWRVASSAQPVPPGLDVGAVVLHEVLVHVQWPARGSTRSLELRTLLPQARPQPGGQRP